MIFLVIGATYTSVVAVMELLSHGEFFLGDSTLSNIFNKLMMKKKRSWFIHSLASIFYVGIL